MRNLKSMITMLCAIGLSLSLLVACSDDDKDKGQGGEGQACYPNGTCNKGLFCYSKLCVRVTDAGLSDGPLADAGGTDQGTDQGKVDAALGDKGIDASKPGGAPTFQWGISAGGTLDDLPAGVAVDGSGNVYVTGQFSDSVSFLGTTIKAQAKADGFVASISSAGKLNWVKTISGAGGVNPRDITVDASGKAVVVGRFTQTITAGSTSLTSMASYDGFLLGMDAKGNFTWAKGVMGNGAVEVTSVALDKTGDAYITGIIPATAVVGGKVVTGPAYAAKIDNKGAWKWSAAIGGDPKTTVGGIALDSSGNSYVVGDFRNTATFGGKAITAKGMQDVFVAKVSSSGSLSWTTTAGGNGEDYGHAVAVDPSGKVQITGSFGYQNATASFGSITLNPMGTVHSNFFLAALDTSGKFVSAAGGGTSKVTVGDAVAAGASGGVIVAGRFSGSGAFGKHSVTCNSLDVDLFLVGADTAGSYHWAVNTGGTTGKIAKNYVRDIAVGKSGEVYLVGDFRLTASYGGKTYSSKGMGDVMVLKFK